MSFLISASSAAALVFYLPGVCTHILTLRENRKGQSLEYFKKFRKNTIFNEHPVPATISYWIGVSPSRQWAKQEIHVVNS